MSRREALRASAAGLAAFLAATRLTGCGSTRSARGGRPFRRPNGKRVVVVGAGFAGLACAYELLAFGYDVAVVDARARVGGRVLSFKDLVPGKVVEGGAELIGSNHLTWQAYASQFGLRMLDVTTDDDLDYPIRIGGRMLDGAASERLWRDMERALSSMNEMAVGVDPDAPWDAPDAARLDRTTVAQWIEGLDADSDTRQALRIVLSSDNAVAVESQSLLGMLAQVAGGGFQSYWEDSEVYRCRGGNQQLSDRLLEEIRPFRVLLNAPVESIQFEGVARVHTAGGQRVEGDEIVLTAPPSVWGKIFFDPGLPQGLSPQMGTAVKHLSALRTRYWRALGLAPEAVTDGPCALTWEGTNNQPGSGAALHVFSGGPAADRLREGTRAEIDQRVRAELEPIFPGYGAQLAARAAESGGATRFMDWPADPWALTGYSFPAPGQITRIGPALRDGMHNLRFAGEHTCPGFVGYMEGALRSGVMLAQRMALRDGIIGPGQIPPSGSAGHPAPLAAPSHAATLS